MRFRRHAWLLLVILPVAVHWPTLSGWLSENPIFLESGLGRSWVSNGVLPGQPGWIDGNAGVTLQALGRLVAHDWRVGIVPWWNPYSGVGMPLAGEVQPAAFFLPFVLLLGLATGVVILKITVQILAGLATFALLRQLGVCRTAALLGGWLFQLNGTFAWAADSPILPVAFLPLFLLGIERAWDAARQRRRCGWVLMALALGYSLVSGFPETAYIDGLLGLAWATLRMAQSPGFRWRFGAGIIAGGLTGLLLAAPVLAAFASFLGQTANASRDFGQLGLPAPMFAQFLFPYAYGPIFFGGRTEWYQLGGYASLPVVLLALAALPGGRQRPLRLLLAAWIVLALAKTAAVPGITALWNAIPFVRQVMVFRYACPSWELSLVLLAAFGFDDIMQLTPAKAWRRVAVPAAIAAILCAVALVVGRPVWRDLGSVPTGRAWFLAATGVGLACAGAVVLATAIPAASRRLAIGGVLALDAWLQFSVPLLAGTRGVARELDLTPVAFLQQHLGLQRFYTLGPFAPNYGAYYGLPMINHNYAPVPRAWTDAIRASLDPQADTVTFSGSYPPPQPGQESRPQALARLTAGYEAMGVRYVATLPGADPWRDSPTHMQRVLRSRYLDLFELPAPAPYYEAGACTLTAQTRETLHAECPAPASLIRRELFFPGWRATVNGNTMPIAASGIFETIALPAGDSDIAFRFEPPFGRACIGLSVAGLLICAWGANRGRQPAARPL